MPSQREAAVLLVDVVGSSSLPDFVAGRDRRLRELADRHQGLIAAAYAVTAWDEFQTVLWDWQHLPILLLDIREVFAPWEVYIAVGCGPVSGWRSDRPINETLSGEGFSRARQAMDELKTGQGEKYRRLSRFQTGDDEQDALLNLVYGLHDTLVQQTTERQWETIGAARAGAIQEEVARQLAVQPSTVTRNLKRGHFWQMKETLSVVSALLARRRGARKRATL